MIISSTKTPSHICYDCSSMTTSIRHKPERRKEWIEDWYYDDFGNCYCSKCYQRRRKAGTLIRNQAKVGMNKTARLLKSIAISGDNNPLFGKHHKDSTLQKMSDAIKGEKHPMFGKYHSNKTREQMSLSHLGLQTGTINPNYKNGRYTTENLPVIVNIRSCNNYRKWVDSILKRDNYKCSCGSTINLEAHHIIQFAILLNLYCHNLFRNGRLS